MSAMIIRIYGQEEGDTNKKLTDNFMNKEEYTRLLSIRSAQIKFGAKPCVDIGETIDPIKIAQMEIDQKKIPLHIVRKNIPKDGELTYEIWNPNEMKIRDC